jgi:glycosyltransferase involved in cell wall biosynthesis
MRVLNVLFDERIGGPQLRVLQVARRLKEKGFETIVVMPEGDKTFGSMLEEARIPYHKLKLVRLRQTANLSIHAEFLTRFWRNVAQLRRIIRERGIEVVHTNGLMNVQGAIAARLESVRLVWHLNDTFTPRLLRKGLLPLVRSWSTQIAVAAGAVGDHYFAKTGPIDDRIRVLYAPVDTDKFNPRVTGSQVRQKFGVPHSWTLIGYVGSLDPMKGHRHLLEAAARIKAKCRHIKVLLVGGMLTNRQDYSHALNRQAQEWELGEDVIFAGQQNDMPEIFRAMDIYVHPSESEACPMAVMEASASGLPVVATDVGGTRELVEDGVTGLLVEPRNPGQIAEGVLQLLAAPDLMHRMGVAGAERMRRFFSLESCVAQHVRIYAAALGLNLVTAGPDAEPARARHFDLS